MEKIIIWQNPANSINTAIIFYKNWPLHHKCDCSQAHKRRFCMSKTPCNNPHTCFTSLMSIFKNYPSDALIAIKKFIEENYEEFAEELL